MGQNLIKQEISVGKENQDAFADCHPIVNFIYFVSVIAFGMMSLHPVCLMIAFMGAFAYSVCLGGRKAVLRNLRYMIPVIILTALINPDRKSTRLNSSHFH